VDGRVWRVGGPNLVRRDGTKVPPALSDFADARAALGQAVVFLVDGARAVAAFAVRQIAGVYYSHPYAWDEIGFGGPAYPRGYFALNHGEPEPWEVREAPSSHVPQPPYPDSANRRRA
jgi:hypothetical protein